MEIKRLLQEKFSEEKGNIVYIFIILVTLLITLFLCVIEYYRVTELYDDVTTEMERAANIAVEYAMNDEARGYHLSKIDESIAQEQFNTYFIQRLKLNSSFEQFVDGDRYYKVEFTTFNIDVEIPQIQMQGTLCIDLQLVKNYVTVPIELPFDIKTRNVNVEE